MKIRLSEQTAAAVLDLVRWKEESMTALETLQKEQQETKQAMASVVTAVQGLITKYQELFDKAAVAVTPEQFAAAKADFDAVQTSAQALIEQIGATLNPPPPPPAA